ncbi:MAG: hypothetical protein SGARI_000980, partial [Bacillariaceae sp.]
VNFVSDNPESNSLAEGQDDKHVEESDNENMRDNCEDEGGVDLHNVDIRHLSSLCPNIVTKGGKLVARNQETMGLIFGLMNDTRAWQKIKSGAVIASLLYRTINKTCKKPTDHHALLRQENEERIPIPFNYFLEYDDKKRMARSPSRMRTTLNVVEEESTKRGSLVNQSRRIRMTLVVEIPNMGTLLGMGVSVTIRRTSNGSPMGLFGE